MAIDLKYISLNGVSLQPLDATIPKAHQHDGYLFTANTRLITERRVTGDRRSELRFETNRRSDDRRANRAWENAKNL